MGITALMGDAGRWLRGGTRVTEVAGPAAGNELVVAAGGLPGVALRPHGVVAGVAADGAQLAQPGAAPIAEGALQALQGRRVLIFMTDTTSGHVRMAEALKHQILETAPDAVVAIKSGYEGKGSVLGSKATQERLRSYYSLQQSRFPWLNAVRHDIQHGGANRTRVSRNVYERLFTRQVAAQIDEFKPDVVVSTHEAVTAALSHLRRSGRLDIPTVAALIDRNPHPLWLAGGIDLHITPFADDVIELQKAFVPAARSDARDTLRIVAASPPVDPGAIVTIDRAATRLKYGIPADRQVVVVSGGSLGFPYPDTDINRLIKETNAHVVIAHGRNEVALAHALETFPKDRVTSLGFINDMPAVIGSADATIMPNNGMGSYEAFRGGTPVIFFKPVPGQGPNLEGVHRSGQAVFAQSTDELVASVKQLELDPAAVQVRVDKARALFSQDQSYAQAILGVQTLKVGAGR